MDATTADEPLIWTSKGNLPVSALRYETGWHFEPGKYIQFRERYFLGDELVKESAHVLQLTGVTVDMQSGNLGG